MSALCASEHCRPAKHGGPRRAASRSTLCDVCIQRTWDDLQAVARLYDETALVLIHAGAHQERSAPGPSSGLNISEFVMRIRGEVKTTLTFWVHVLLDEERIGQCPPVDDVPKLATLIATHLDHLTRNVDEGLQVSIREDAYNAKRSLRRALGFDPSRRVDTGIPCIEAGVDDMGARVPCEGTYAYTVRERMEEFPDLVCSADPDHRIAPEGFRRVARRPDLIGYTHGRSGYNRGCPCAVCRDANREHTQRWRSESVG